MTSKHQLQNLLRSHTANECVLFVGAGFSLGAERISESGGIERVPSTRELVETMQEALNDDSNDLGDLSNLYIKDFGEYGLYNLMKQKFTISGETDTQSIISNFPWKEIYTTNYDNVVENCLEKRSQNYIPLSTNDKINSANRKQLPIIHINGFIPNCPFERFKEEIRLTSTQYLSSSFSDSKWGEKFRSDIITSPCIVFAGYSLFDIDVGRIIHSFEGMKNRIFFIIEENARRSTKEKLSEFGTVLEIGSDGLSDMISKIDVKNRDITQKNLQCWEKFNPLTPDHKAGDIEVANFLTYGSYREDTFSSDVIHNHERLMIRRTITEDVIKLVNQKTYKNIVITSHRGNGKSCFLQTAAYILSSMNIDVFNLNSYEEEALKEVPLLKNLDNPTVLIIDDALLNINLIKSINNSCEDKITILTLARTTHFEFREEEFSKSCFENYFQFNIDELNENECTSLIRLLDRSALWGARQPQNESQKLTFIRQHCSSEIRFVILSLLDSPSIKERMSSLIDFKDNLPEERKLKSILVISQALNLAGIEPNISLISEILNVDAYKTVQENKLSIIDFSIIKNGKITLRSPMFAEYMIKYLVKTPFVISTLISSMHQIDEIHENKSIYREIFKNFSRFRFIETTIPKEKRLKYLVEYFEGIKELNNSREHSLFWLQYAMCRMSLEQYKEAERLFEVSFSFAKKKGYRENRHLENQWARFLLESRTNTNDYIDFAQSFNEAHKICLKQIRNEPKSYNPFRVASDYLPFIERRIADLDNHALISTLRSCNELMRAIRSTDKSIEAHAVVEQGRKSIEKSIEIIVDNLRSKGYDFVK